MKCGEAREWMGALADSEVRGIGAWRVLRHLRRCEACRRAYRSLLAWKERARQLGALSAPASLHSRVADLLRSLPTSVSTTHGRTPILRRLRLWQGTTLLALLTSVALAAGRTPDSSAHRALPHLQAAGHLDALATNAVAPAEALGLWLHLSRCRACFAAFEARWRRAHPGVPAPEAGGPSNGPCVCVTR